MRTVDPTSAQSGLDGSPTVTRLHAVRPFAERSERLTVDGGLGVLARSFAEQVGAATALLVVRDGDSSLAPVRAAWGLDLDTAGAAIRRGEGAAGRLLEGGRAEVLDLEAADDPIAGSQDGARVVASVGAAVRTEDGVVGALLAGLTSHPEAERSRLVWTARSYAASAALCLQGSNLFTDLVSAAMRDPLTGCLNYGALREALDREVGRCERHSRPLTCCFLDLDGFKEVNDTHGHLAGNRALEAVAESLTRGVRSSDLVGRFGGDEFVVVLPDADRAAALLLVQRLRDDIREATAACTGRPIRASIGIAGWEPRCGSEELLERADRALRLAKQAGGGVSFD